MPKRYAPATHRNRDPILDVLREVLPRRGRVLEVAAGTGEHAIHFAGALPEIVWHPTDADPSCLTSIDAWAAEAELPNVAPAALLDAVTGPWPGGAKTSAERPFDAVLCCNMIHIAPWEACVGLLTGAGRVLTDGGLLVMYGPFSEDGRHTAPSNVTFDASLRAQSPKWGVRDLSDVAAEAARHGLKFEQRFSMPANNLTVVFRAVQIPD